VHVVNIASKNDNGVFTVNLKDENNKTYKATTDSSKMATNASMYSVLNWLADATLEGYDDDYQLISIDFTKPLPELESEKREYEVVSVNPTNVHPLHTSQKVELKDVITGKIYKGVHNNSIYDFTGVKRVKLEMGKAIVSQDSSAWVLTGVYEFDGKPLKD
jgi:hypothetical protein